MRRRRFKLLVIPLASLLFVCGILAYVELKYREGSYATLDEAQGTARGWLPKFVPPSASAIEEVHNLDLNTMNGRLTFDARDDAALRGDLSLLPPGTSLCGSRDRAPADWPKLLVGGRVDAAAAKSAGLELFVFREQHEVRESEQNQFGVAIDWKARTLMYWSIHCDVPALRDDG